MLRLRTLGGCFLERDGTRLDGVSGQRKGLALLALLAAAGDAGVSRDAASVFLWPESDEVRAAASLKQLVHSIRQQLASAEVLLGPATLRLNTALVTSDVAEFRHAMRRADADLAVSLYSGPFLDGFMIRDTATFERWTAETRATLAAQYAASLETLAERATARGDVRGAVEWWRRRQGADPWSGRVAAGLMQALDAAGDRAGALRHAQIHEALLQQEVGASASDPIVTQLAVRLSNPVVTRIEPPPASVAGPEPTYDSQTVAPTRAAGAATRRQRYVVAGFVATVAGVGILGMWAFSSNGERGDEAMIAAAAEPVQTASVPTRRNVPRPSVVVLPFANTSGNATDEHLADGLTDELISALGKVAGLKVAPRTSTFALKGKGLDLRTVADTLSVSTALEGSVRRAGEQLRVTVALVDVGENRVLWSETYNRSIQDVFAVQQEIANAVVGELKVTLAAAPTSAAIPAARDLVAYELYLKGQFFRYQLNGIALQRAVGFFERAIQRDPGYARAHAGLADAHALLVLFGDRPPREGFRRARAAAATALRLDSMLAEGHASLGHIETAHDWNWESAGPRLERAIALDPSATTIRLWRGLWLFDQRRFGEAKSLLEETLAADPLSTPVRLTLGRMYVSMRQPDRAIPYLRGVLELNPRLSYAHQQLGHALLQKRVPGEAIAEFERAAILSGMRDSAQLAYAYAVTGRRAAAEQIVDQLLQSSARRYVSPFDIAVAYTGLGDVDAAFRWLEQAFTEHAAGMDTIAITPAFEPLFDDPRWARLLGRMGLSQ
ncbi:MAG TPA: tetratricopeptide repeat protein [Gemmatimonas sp.]|nr:tetratricopeptide repeat protein [Gemmatimonas sp.]